MKSKLTPRTLAIAAGALFALGFPLTVAFAQGTAFTYQGRLNDGAAGANGTYDLRFAIYDASSFGTQQGVMLTNSATAASNGLFVVTLDFGNQFPGANRWLEIGVRTNGNGTFFSLSPRQRITAAPYSIAAATVTGTVAAGQVTGTIGLAQLPGAILTNSQSGVSLTGSFIGNGAQLTNLNLQNANSFGAFTFKTNFPGLFVLASSPGVGASPNSVTTADVNGDGKPDLISADFSSGTLTVLTNNGSGGFTQASSPGVNGQPISVTTTDVNGDGKPDLISANFNSSTLTVLTNDGTGGFVLASSPNVGSQPYWVITVDVNGDGKPDLINANLGTNTLTVLTNNGTGNFAVASSPVVGSQPASIAAADVNGDGKPDLISCNYNSSTVQVLTNNGTGGFILASSPGAGFNIVRVAAADLNGDGKPDLITANLIDNTLTVLTNNGSGGFPTAASYAVGSHPNSMVAGDVNGDGKIDLICANSGADTLSVLINNGNGSFAPAYSSPTVGSQPSSIAAVDVNGDNMVDLISANTGTNTLSVLFNQPLFTVSFSGNGQALTNLSAASLISGTLSDARLTANVALRGGGNSFTGNQSVTGTVTAVSAVTEGFEVGGAAAGYALQDRTTGIAGRWSIYASNGTLAFLGGSANRLTISAAGAVTALSFNPTSDRNAKENFAPVQPLDVLEKVVALPLSSWNYKADAAIRHVGPMAQDFFAAFNVGPDDKHIATVDADGVALAAIQGLNQKLEETRAENVELKQQLTELKQLVQSIVAKH